MIGGMGEKERGNIIIREQERRKIREKERETERDRQTDFFIIIRLPPEFLPAPGPSEW